MSNPSTRTARWDLRAYVLPALILIVWAALTLFDLVNTKVIVPPQLVVTTAFSELLHANFYAGVGMSLWRDLAGFSLGATAGIALGVLLGVSPLAALFIGPTFHTLRQISLFAWLPLLGAIAGSGDLSKIIFVAFSTFYPVVLATLEGVRSVSQSHSEVARIYGFSRRQLFFRLILPAASPQILSGIKLGLVYAWLATIGAEFLLNDFSNGLGMIVFKGRAAFRVELILFGLLAIGLVGYGFNRIAEAAERYLLRWRAPVRT